MAARGKGVYAFDKYEGVAQRKKDAFFNCYPRELEAPIVFVARMWTSWQEACPYGVDGFVGISTLTNHLPPIWHEWASEVSWGYVQSGTSISPPFGDMPGFVKMLMRTMVDFPEESPMFRTMFPPASRTPTSPLNDFGSGAGKFEVGGTSRPHGAKRPRLATDDPYDSDEEEPSYGRHLPNIKREEYDAEDEAEETPNDVANDYAWTPVADHDTTDSPQEEEGSPKEDEGPTSPTSEAPQPVLSESTFGYLSPFPSPSGDYFFIDYPDGNGYFIYPPLSPMAPPAPAAPADPASPSIEEIFPDQSGKTYENPVHIVSGSEVED